MFSEGSTGVHEQDEDEDEEEEEDKEEKRKKGEHFWVLTITATRMAVSRGPVFAMVVTLGVVPARLCLTLPRTTPRLRVLIPISPFKFLWYEQHAGQLSIGRQELCSARVRDREMFRHARHPVFSNS